MERQQSFRLGAFVRLPSFRMGALEKQKSFRNGAMEKQQSFRERKSKESPGKKGDEALHLAARAGNMINIQKILSDCDESQLKDLISKQNQDGETALYVAAERGFLGIVQEILKVSDAESAGIKAKNGFDSFHIAAKEGHTEVVRELLQSFPALAMTTNLYNGTALDTAATQGHIDIVNLLLETGADLAKIARNNGKTVLHSAARPGHVKVVKSLLDKDPTIGFRTDRKGQTAFHMAVKGNNVEMIMELLKPDQSIVNLKDNRENTALHIATRKGWPEIVHALISVHEIDINAANRAGETALTIAEKCSNEEVATILRKAGAVSTPREPNTPQTPAKQLKQTVSDIKHDVKSQIKQTRQTEQRVHHIKKRLQKLHLGGLNNAINSNTVVAVLIATVAFAAIFTVPGQYVEPPIPVGTDGELLTLGQAYIASNAAFIIFLVFDSLALFISLAVVVVQTSLIVVEQKAKKLMVFVMNKLMWLACLFISVSFIALTYVVVGSHDLWLAWCTMAIGATIMITTIGSMCYCIVVHRIEENSRNIRTGSGSRSRSWSLTVASDSEILHSEYKKMYAL